MNSEKKIILNLKKIKGINIKTASIICIKFGTSPSLKKNFFEEKHLNELNQIIYNKYNLKTNKDLLKIIKDNIQLLKRVKSYKGFRHYQYLPVSGQRTKTNAKTRKIRKIT